MAHDEAITRAAEAVRGAKAIIITAGAGMGVDSGLPDFRGPEGFWRAYPPYQALGLAFEDLADQFEGSKELRDHLKSLQRDVQSITDHSSYVASNITFLLDAALGLINIEQNSIFKVFSVFSVMFLPPTLVAGIYGMNFVHMPELNWLEGYPMAIGMMIMAAVAPLLWFRRKGWL